MRLADFIIRDIELIIAEWQAFAATQLPAAEMMSPLSLRDHADGILQAMALDLATPQTGADQLAKSHGKVPCRADAPHTAAQTHGVLRAQSGFDINQIVAEYRALRASVLRLWFEACGTQPPHLDDVVRFNEAVDQALADSVAFYNEQVQRSRNLFLGMLGHDMRTPLQAIVMSAGYLGKIVAGAAVAQCAARLVKSAQRMQTLLDDLVDYNRVNLGLGIPVKRHPADIEELFEEEVALARAAHPDRNITLQVAGDTKGLWDGTCLRRMLDNLVSNALKYGSRHSPVRVIVNGQAKQVSVEVHNEGASLDPQALEGLFDPLKRGMHLEEPHGDDRGLGLGLYIAREVAKAHGGEIRARSSEGTTVFVASLARESP